MPRATQISIQDVAREAGVSPQTVSRVANDSDAVRPQTRIRVEAAMEKLGYRPNYAARALKYGRFQNIGVVAHHLENYGNSRILNGIITAADNEGYSITVQTIQNDFSNHSLKAIAERMKQQPVDAVIVVPEERVPDFAGFRPPKDLPKAPPTTAPPSTATNTAVPSQLWTTCSVKDTAPSTTSPALPTHAPRRAARKAGGTPSSR